MDSDGDKKNMHRIGGIVDEVSNKRLNVIEKVLRNYHQVVNYSPRTNADKLHTSLGYRGKDREMITITT